MNLEKKSKICDDDIKNSEEFKNDSIYVKGFFSDVDTIDDNNDFLSLYRYIQCWKKEIPDSMNVYACVPNYSPESLIENMKLTGEDTYFEHFKKLILNEENEYCTDCITVPFSDDKVFTELATLNRADLAQKYYTDGNSPNDIYTTSVCGNATLEIIKILMQEGYVPSDDVIIWYIKNGMGKVAIQSITECSDLEFICDEIPHDIDFLNYLIINEYEGSLPPEKAEYYIYENLESKNPIDVAMFIRLLRLATTLSVDDKFRILSHILKRDELMLISTVLTELDDLGFSRHKMEDIICYNVKSIPAYIIFKLVIEKSNNYEHILDYCCELKEDEETEWVEDDFTKMMNEQYDSTDSESNGSEEADGDSETHEARNYIATKYDHDEDSDGNSECGSNGCEDCNSDCASICDSEDDDN